MPKNEFTQRQMVTQEERNQVAYLILVKEKELEERAKELENLKEQLCYLEGSVVANNAALADWNSQIAIDEAKQSALPQEGE